MFGIVLINWLIPMLHCFIRSMTGYGTVTEDFTRFYWDSSIVFLVSYLAFILYSSFADTAFPRAYKTVSDSFNFTPFNVISEQIEDYLYGVIPLSDIVIYLTSRILLYAPYGFYISLAQNSRNRLVKSAFLLLLPFLLEALQFFIINERCDIDELLYGFIGGLIGNFLFFLVNAIYHVFSGKDFLSGDKSSHYSVSSHYYH
jgi:VanZ like family.